MEEKKISLKLPIIYTILWLLELFLLAAMFLLEITDSFYLIGTSICFVYTALYAVYYWVKYYKQHKTEK